VIELSTSAVLAAINNLPRPLPGLAPEVIDIPNWPLSGRYRVTFVVRRDSRPHTHTWSWSIEHAERIDAC